MNIVCGPYEVIHLDGAKRYRGIPMAIYCRKSLLQYAQQEQHNIFEFNKKGVEFYEGIFNLDYPFGKLDTIFCPEYTVGAMEYPGAVTYTEHFLPKNKNTTKMVSLRGCVILHELAHMWFGNAVTMRWWNGLWLNESFADFVCFMAWKEIRAKLDFETYDAWLDFSTNKFWGYKEDQEKTTHQIAAEVADTEEAANIFDGITYSKGAAALRQLTALVGVERFSSACTEYFQEHKWGNTDLKDLLDMFQKHLGDRASEHKAFNISNWQATWLEKAGMNTVKATWEAGASSLVLTQGVCLAEHPTLRFHRIDVGFYNSEGKVIKVQEVILEDQEITTIAIEGGIPSETVSILPNYNDFSFIKILLDNSSLAWFENNINKIDEPLAQGLIMRSLYDGVRDARYKISSFIKVCSELIQNSNSNQVVDLTYGLLGSSISFLPEASFEHNYHTLYRVTRHKLLSTDCSQFALSLVQKLISYGFHLEDILDLKSWLEGSNQDLNKFALSIDDKWSIVSKVNAREGINDEDKKKAYEDLYAQDESDSKKNMKLKIEALNTPVSERAALFDEYFNKDTKWSYVELEFSIEGYTSHFKSEEIRKPYFELFFKNIVEALRIRSRQVAMVIYCTFTILLVTNYI